MSHLATRPARSPRRRVTSIIGLVLILGGVSVLGYVAWQYFGTNIVSKQKQAQIKKEVVKNWEQGKEGPAVSLLRIPRFGDDYEVPIVKGFDDDSLSKGVGWYPDGAKPGAIGNFAIAGHRVTHGEPFRDFLKLRKGDLIIVETRAKIFTYKLRDDGDSLKVDFTVGWPLQPVPDPALRGEVATEPVLTMLTCSELFHTRDRNVIFGDLIDTEVKKASRASAAKSADKTQKK